MKGGKVSFRAKEAALLAVLGLTVAYGAAGATRYALVIGNTAYGSQPLVNAVNDARLLRDTLTSDGFQVTYLENANRTEMLRAIQALGAALSEGGQETVGLFYFSGHGVQYQETNYLLPVKEDIRSDADLLPSAVDAAYVLAQMQQANNRLDIVILDACRNNPLPARNRDATKGLVLMKAPQASLLAFATEAGGVASDGSGSHSPYAEALAHYMLQPRLEMLQMFSEVARRVYDATNKEQTPTVTYKVTPTFYFREDGQQPQPQPQPLPPSQPPPQPQPLVVAHPPAPEPDRAWLQTAIDGKFISWSEGWITDRYVPDSAQLDSVKCEGRICRAEGHFTFNRLFSGQHVIPFSAVVQKDTDQYVLGRLCYTDTTLGTAPKCIN
jgi:hypothetical protein